MESCVGLTGCGDYGWVLQTQSKGRHCSQAEQFPGTAPPHLTAPAQSRGADGHTQMGASGLMGDGLCGEDEN